MIDWSYDLLNESEKTLLARLSIFAGGWTLEAAEIVCDGEPIAAHEVLDLLTSLCDKSLVVSEPSGGVSRYRLLETVRQYAQERLWEASEEQNLRHKHRKHYLRFVESVEESRIMARDANDHWSRRIAAEIDNLRAAMEGALLEPGGVSDLARMTGSLQRFWFTRSEFREEQHWLEAALAVLTSQSAPNANGEQSEVRLLAQYGRCLSFLNRIDEAKSVLSEAIRLGRNRDEPWPLACALHAMGLVHVFSDEWAEAKPLLEEALELTERVGKRDRIVAIWNDLGEAERGAGDSVAARRCYRSAIETGKGFGPSLSIYPVANLGVMAAADEDALSAGPLLASAAAVALEMGDRRLAALIFQGVAELCVIDSPEVASRLIGAADACYAATGTALGQTDAPQFERVVARARAALGDATFEEARSAGRLLTFEHAIELARRSQ